MSTFAKLNDEWQRKLDNGNGQHFRCPWRVVFPYCSSRCSAKACRTAGNGYLQATVPRPSKTLPVDYWLVSRKFSPLLPPTSTRHHTPFLMALHIWGDLKTIKQVSDLLLGGWRGCYCGLFAAQSVCLFIGPSKGFTVVVWSIWTRSW